MRKDKYSGQHPKSIIARARWTEAEREEEERRAKEMEDSYWQQFHDEKASKKQSKKNEIEKKRQEKIHKKQESHQLERDEADRIVKEIQARNPIKVTQAEIAAEKEKDAVPTDPFMSGSKGPKPEPLEENLNRTVAVEEAKTIDEALKMFNDSSTNMDRHPERRIKLAYLKFEKARMRQLKAANPSFRMSQLSKVLFQEWKKSPENPMNQEHAAYNS